MAHWLGGKYKSIRFRLLFAFSLMLLAAFFLLGVYLDRSFSQSKQLVLEQQLKSQYNIVSFCITNTNLLDKAKLSSCNEMQNKIERSFLYFYDLDDSLFAAFDPGSDLDNSQPLHNFTYHVEQAKNWLKVIKNHSDKSFVNVDDFYVYSDSKVNEKRIVIAISTQNLNAQVMLNRFYLVGVLCALLAILAIGFFLVLKRSLKPLDEMVTDLEAIASGTNDQLNNEYSSEFNGMRESLNNLLNAERLQRERYRNTLADLAHSLKTPLAVMQGAASENLDYKTYLSVAGEQIRRMDQIIQYQLTRAVKSIGDGAKTNAVKATPLIERILTALGKVYREKEVRVILNLERNIEINADERDLMEMLGNMLENAFKYCRSEVAVSLYSDNDNVFIILEDDGPGISENMRNTILERGERADTSAAPGQGIGLSVSVDILSSYNCRLEVEDSFSLGGAKFSITFPRH